MDTLVSPIAEVVRAGLSARKKTLPPWLFYDAAGSALFEQITSLPEYYLSTMERELLMNHASAVMDRCADSRNLDIYELGAGSARKTVHLLRAALARSGATQYHPMDISLDAMEGAVRHLALELPALPVRPEVTDFTRAVPAPGSRFADGRKLMLWLGSSAGNYDPAEAVRILRRVTASMNKGDCILLGMDLAPEEGGKPMRDLMAAYEDAAGVTALFNKNLFVRLNRELGADFDLDSFEHEARWNAAASCIEMHLVSRREQSVRIDALEEKFHFDSGESLHTENSYKLSTERLKSLLCDAGFPLEIVWTDADHWYGLFLGEKS